jgi:16S rRNA C967 or C1407 C5-methylase (RsmB/RsmF family)
MSPLNETIAVGESLFSKRAGPMMPPLNGVLVDKMMLQNLPSALVAHALSPKRKDVIFDMCSAPGGKTAHVASLVSNDALIVAADKSRRKMTSSRSFFKNAGATCIHPLALDSTKCIISDKSDYKNVHEIIHEASPSEKDGLLVVKGFYEGSFDRIVLDPPCSALGLRPKLRVVFEDLDALERHTVYQRKFVKNAVALLKRGGTMTYSTCTINVSENEGK